MTDAADRVAKSRKAAGLKSTSVYVTDEVRALWKEMAARRGVSMAQALEESLRALERADNGSGEITAEQVLEWVRRRA